MYKLSLNFPAPKHGDTTLSLIFAYIGIVSILIMSLNARWIGERLGVMDHPNSEGHKSHSVPTPLVGAIMVGGLALLVIANHYVFNASGRMVGVSVCTIMVGILGLFDDRLRLSWKIRLFLIAAICSLLVFWIPEMRVDSLVWSFGQTSFLGPIAGAIFSVLCLMTLVISVNMMDGFNGNVIGFTIIILVCMAFVATNPHRQAICLFLASALGLMFVYNLKGEFFLGDGGAYSLGLLLGALALLTYNADANVTIYADTIFTWLALPTLDCLRVVIFRALKKNSPFFASKDHLHHVLIAAVGPTVTLCILAGTVAFYSTMAIFAGDKTYLVFLLQFLTFALFFYLIPSKRHQREP